MRYLVSPIRSGSPVTLESPFPLSCGERVAFLRGKEIEKGIVLGEGSGDPEGLVVGILPFPLDPARITLCEEISKTFGSSIQNCISQHYPPELESYETLHAETIGMFPKRFDSIDEKVLELLKKREAVLKAEIRRPKVRSRGERTLGVSAGIGDILRMELSNEEMDVVEFLMMEGGATEFELTERFGRRVVSSLLKKGIISELETIERMKLREDQLEALERTSEGITLLMGPTGSGKTEVYIEAARGKRALVLVPEVSLIPQIYRRFRKRLGGVRIGIFHSYLSGARRVEEWLRAVEGETDVLIGTRSAVFVPASWDVMVADEEHDESYYQSEGFVYDAIDVLKTLSSITGRPLILGSATPRLEDYHEAAMGRIKLSRLWTPRRTTVELVDLREENVTGGFAERVLEEMEEVLERGKAVMVFVRRKGFGRVMCRRCGFVAMCEDCDVPLTYHASEGVMRCHICGREYEPMTVCPVCGNVLSVVGSGSERVESFLKKRFPEVRIGRADRDVVSRPDRFIELLDDLEKGRIDVLVGTKMIVKGIDIPRVELMVVRDVDALLSIPDFTARVRVFQLLVQATGRSGRGGRGKAIVQHWGMDEELLEYVRNGDVEGFYRSELERRSEHGYPPFIEIVHVLYSASKRETAEEMTRTVASSLRSGEVLGPTPYPIPRIKGKYTYHFLIKTSDLPTTLEEMKRAISKLDERNWKVIPRPRSLM